MFLFRWIRRTYDFTLQLSRHRHAIWWLAAISFAESSFFPIPPDVILLPLCLANRERALQIAGVCTVSSVLGGLFGYAIGVFAFDSIGQPIINFYGASDAFAKLQGMYDTYGAMMVFIAGFSPIPYKVVTITSGVFSFSILQFVLLSALSRGIRFGIEALIIKRFGEPAMAFIDKHFNTLTIVGAVVFIGGFIAVKLLLH